MFWLVVSVILLSLQPLTQLQDKKCKRCGFYEKDTLKSDDVFDEWEFCASDFNNSNGKYIHFKNGEFNATFLCPGCVPLAGGKPLFLLSYSFPFWLSCLRIDS